MSNIFRDDAIKNFSTKRLAECLDILAPIGASIDPDGPGAEEKRKLGEAYSLILEVCHKVAGKRNIYMKEPHK